MKKFFILFVFLLFTTAADSKIYKWVDENGSVHFSDKPYSKEAKEINVQGTGISVEKTEEQLQAEKERVTEQTRQKQDRNKTSKAKTSKAKSSSDEEKVITEADYRITSGVGKLGADIISISGRISSGPRCKDMTVTATATNENGLSGSIIDNVSKTNSFGSTTFEGNAKVSGSSEDYGFWEVDSVTIRCNDVGTD